MLTDIENAVFRSERAHAVVAFALADARVVIRVAPWEDLAAVTEACFDEAELQHVWGDSDNTPEIFELPWDICGFDCSVVQEGRWEFCINCFAIEFVWRSTWPSIRRT